MEIELQNLSRRFAYHWVFHNLSCRFSSGQHYAITGSNGSGKSTLLKILSGHLSPTKGAISYRVEGRALDRDSIYRHLSYAAPYIELIEEFTLSEAIHFHQQFKPFRDNLTADDFVALIDLEKARKKAIRSFSSGMKQRLKLGFALCVQSDLVLLDEPTATLDRKAIKWYHQLLSDFGKNRLIIIASNEERDLLTCKERISMLDYKKNKQPKM